MLCCWFVIEIICEIVVCWGQDVLDHLSITQAWHLDSGHNSDDIMIHDPHEMQSWHSFHKTVHVHDMIGSDFTSVWHVSTTDIRILSWFMVMVFCSCYVQVFMDMSCSSFHRHVMFKFSWTCHVQVFMNCSLKSDIHCMLRTISISNPHVPQSPYRSI